MKYSHRWKQVFYHRGRTRFAVGRFRDATKDFDRAIKIDKNYIEAYYQRSLARFARKKYKDAIKDSDRVISRNPHYAGAYENKGNSFLALKKTTEARLAFQQAAKIYSQKQHNSDLQRVKKILAQL
ncbi:tetratricopeptide repeat protein [Mastigocoleus sp. MO_188.B34]|uniref:tetratricopeptide repeat protein n=1 Tax=Mastigocoleus sp. MO_188.B34 TaxID=3036635 RepID=UPI002614BF7A|nr:tetratricopeptide repeat protein [Mastigocoleus sp. MO_188.B34]MDJ0696208.1 tetratricopeptide repeat protein [Mastigocoleus sp. MO_188.B34]